MPDGLGAELRAARQQLGISQTEVARRWGVSKHTVSKIERGKMPGTNYQRSVAQLQRGIAAPPVRRTTRTGELAKVRAPAGATVTPTAPPPAPARGAFGVQVGYTRAGGRAIVVSAPRSRGIGRDRARAALMDEVRRASDGQRVVIRVHSAETGRDYTIGKTGGYRAGTLASRWAAEGDDPFAWLADTLDGMGYDVDASSLTTVTLSYL